MSFSNFQEYLNSRKVVGKPIVKDVADEIDMPKQKAKDDPMNKNKYSCDKQPQLKENKKGLAGDPKVKLIADFTPPSGENMKKPLNGKPYAASKNEKKAKEGLADEGETKTDMPDCGYVKDTKSPNGGKALEDVWKKTKTEQFLDKTRHMHLKEFTDYMLKECGCDETEDLPMVTAYASGKFHPHPPEAIKYIAALANKNERILTNLIHEIKRMGGLPKMMKALMDDHPESYGEITSLLGDLDNGPERASCLSRSMNDNYIKFIDDQDGLYESVSPPYGMEDEEEMDYSSEDEESSDEEMPDEDMMPQDDVPDEHEEEMDIEPMEKEEKPSKKLKRKFAHDHLLGSMSKYDHMREKMKHYMDSY